MQDNFHRPADHEAKMARADLFKCAQYSFKLFKMIQEDQELEGWVQAKITKAADYIASVYHYMEYEMKISEYGSAIENSDMYSESIRRAFAQKLTEAKEQAKKAKAKMDEQEAELEEGFPTVADAKARAEKEKTTGKFDKKEIKPGVTQYTRKSATFTDGGDDSDTKKAKKKAKETNEGIADVAKKVGGALKAAGSKALDKLGHGSDEDMIKDLQKKVGMPQTGKKPMAVQNEAAKPDFLDMDKDGNKKEPMKKAVADKKKNPFAKTNEAADKCNHTAKGEKCPVHGLKECGGMYEGDKFDPLKHVKNPTKGEKDAAKDVKRGSYADRAAMLKSAEADGRLKKESTGDYSAKKAAAGKDIGKPGKNFAKIEKSAGGGEKGKKIAGAVLAKLRAKG